MTRTQWYWLVLAGLYVVFFCWYTSFEGPLDDEEIADFISRIESSEPPVSPEMVAVMRKFMEEDTGDDFVMVNVIDMYETPLRIEGVASGETSDEVLGKYMAYMYPAMFARASHPVFFGRAANSAMDLMNAEGFAEWSAGAGIRYRSRRDLLEIATDLEFSASHEFKTAAIRKTIAFPIDPWIHLGDPRLLLALLFGLLGSGLSWREALRQRVGSR